MNFAEVLCNYNCFRGLDKKQIHDFLQVMELKPFQRNQMIWREDEHKMRVGFVVEGRIKLVRHRASGKDLIISIISSGEMIDLSLVPCNLADMNLIGLAQGSMLTINRDLFLEKIAQNTSLAINMLLESTKEKWMLISRLDEVSTGTVESRLASLLFRLSQVEGVKAPYGIKLQMPLSRQDLADMVNSTIETTIRIMSKWNRDSVVLTQRDGFLIPDLKNLYSLIESPLNNLP